MENAVEVSIEPGEEEQNLNYPKGSRNNCPSKWYLYKAFVALMKF